ncbi:MAG: phosphohistidine swiveling domain-containing protein [Crocinitomix sp.]
MSIKRGDKDYILTPELGGKAKGLLRLVQMNYQTPTFYILPHTDIIEHIAPAEAIDNLLLEWTRTYQIDPSKKWAVRSSAAQEDGLQKSYAGQFLTELNVTCKGLNKAIQNVLLSYQKSDEYKERTFEASVIIQEMIPADYAGVLFTLDPTNILSNNAVLQVTPGLGDKLVNGELEGLIVTGKDGELAYGDLKATYGVENKKELGHDIQSKIGGLLEALILAAETLEQKLGYPLDVEFAFYKNRIYWLQVRPITSRPYLKNYLIWDKTAAETSYPDITLPLSVSYTTHTFQFAYHSVDKAIGYSKRILEQNKAFISQMSGEIDGRLYYNVTAWQSLIYQMPFGKKISGQLPGIWGMNPLPFPKPAIRHNLIERTLIGLRTFLMLRRLPKYDSEYQAATQSILKAPSIASLSKLSHVELIKTYEDIENQLKGQWFAPMSTGFYAMIYYNRLKKKLNGTAISEKYPNFLNDILMQDGTVISVEIVRKFQHLLEEIHQDSALNSLFESESESGIFATLKSDFPTLHAKIHAYIKAYGCRASTSELKMETITYREDPLAFITVLKVNLKNYVSKKETVTPVHYTQILKEAYPYHFLRRRRLGKLIQKTVSKTKARENYRFMRTETFAVVRRIFLAMGDRIYTDKKIDASRDVLYLTFAQLMNRDLTENYRQIISDAKLRYSNYDADDDLIRYVEIKGEIYPIQEKSNDVAEGTLTGVGCCSGIAEGLVKIIRTTGDLEQDFNGCIVIAKYFEPGWINVFSQASGIVSERGNLLSHTSIISRELGVPSIVGVKGIMTVVENLESIKINGAKGIVYL